MSETKAIYVSVADEIRDKHPHGQLLFETPGVFLNFACDADDQNIPIVEPMRRQLRDFLAGDADALEFEAPHVPGACYLTRYAAAKVIAVIPAWSGKVLPRSKTMRLLDATTGLPMVRSGS